MRCEGGEEEEENSVSASNNRTESAGTFGPASRYLKKTLFDSSVVMFYINRLCVSFSPESGLTGEAQDANSPELSGSDSGGFWLVPHALHQQVVVMETVNMF